ncbi:unnamed protein product [Brugia timori]|uniref:TGF_BETA_2 domain-containing protein n=1 Tax=Brugia timori TaxID=42155 RepID=A0A0R3QCC2_9BILA|nr:unnamed protein product [Brugia timori]
MAIINLNIGGEKNLRIFIDDIKSVKLKYSEFDLSKQMLRCNNQCPKSLRPILFIKAEIFRQKRQKREIRSDEDCSSRKCCLKSRYFQFQNSGFEHITTPNGFLMNFCDGICDQTLIPATNDRNALVQAMKISNLHFNPFKDKWVCCVPIKFASINVSIIK